MDVEANYAVVKAYQYTTLTSVQVGVGCDDPQFNGNVTEWIFSFLHLASLSSPDAGLFCDPGPDHPVLVDSEDTLRAGSLCGRVHLSAWSWGHGGGRPAGWTRPRLQ